MASKNGIEVATAYVTIVPSMQGSQQTISKEMGAAAGVAGTEAGQIAGKNFGESLKGTGAKMSRAGGTLTKTVTLPFVAASAAAISAASDFDENLNKVDVAFGSSADRVKAWSETATEQFGLSRNAALEITSQFGDMGTSMGLTDDAAADMSISLAGLAGDLSSFKNISSDEALTALNGIFTGETESLKRLGVVMTQTNLKQFAADQGLVYDQMSQAELVTLRYNYVLQQTANAQGDYSRTSDGTANSMRTFQSSVENLGIAFGQNLLPVITPLIQAGTKLVDGFGKLSPAAQKTILVVGGVAAAAGPLLSIGGKITSGIGSLAGTFGNLAGKLGGLGNGIGGIAGKLSGLGSAGSSAAGGVSAASSSFSQMGGQALLLVAAGAAVLMIAAGIKILADSAIALADAGPGAVAVLVLLAGVALGLTAGIVAIGSAATVSAVGLLALGAAVLMVSAGISLIILSLTLFVQQLPILAEYGAQAAAALLQLSVGMGALTITTATLGVAMLTAIPPVGLFTLELLALNGNVLLLNVGFAAMAAVLLVITGEMAAMAASARSTASDMQTIVDSTNTVSGTLNALKTTAQSVMTTVTGLFVSGGAKILGTAQATYPAITALAVTNGTLLTAAWGAALLALNVETAKGMDKVKRTVDKALDSIARDFKNTKFTFGRSIALPHFSMSGSFNAQTGSVPSVSVQWYRDAALQGARFASPRLIGVGDASQPELLIGENTLYDSIEQAAGGAAGGNITIPVYIGQEKLDTIVVKAQQRANYRSGGR